MDPKSKNEQPLEFPNGIEDFPFQLGNYQVMELIGAGGFGLVYRAIQSQTGQEVAIKMIKANYSENPEKYQDLLSRFERETLLCAQLNHPHIVRFIDKGRANGQGHFAVFEFVRGMTLKQFILNHKGLSPQLTAKLMAQVLDGLAAAHKKGIIHRDLKTHNIMVTDSGLNLHVSILDFGIGTLSQGTRLAGFETLTLTNEMLGTPAYCAPEQLRGEPTTPRTDLYSWGLIFLECLTGRQVFQGGSVAEVFQQQLNWSSIPLPPAIAGHPISNLLLKVLEKDPSERPGSAEEIYQELAQINMETLVGEITSSPVEEDADDLTLANSLEWRDRRSELRQITVVALKAELKTEIDTVVSQEVFDALQKDQLNVCKNILLRYGGFEAGRITNHLLFYFGYPTISDQDPQHALKAVQEITNDFRTRKNYLQEQFGIRIHLKTCLHTGKVLSSPNVIPTGQVPNFAFDLIGNDFDNGVLVSQDTYDHLSSSYIFEPFEQVPGCYLLTGERSRELANSVHTGRTILDFVGREREKEALESLWHSVQEGESRIAVINGAAGIGKSRLVEEFASNVRNAGGKTFWTNCHPEHQNNALHPILELVIRELGLSSALKADRRQWIQNARSKKNVPLPPDRPLTRLLKEKLQLARVENEITLAVFCFWLNIPLDSKTDLRNLDPKVQKTILFDLLYQLIFHFSSRQPFVLIVEDIHWIDPTTEEFLAELNTRQELSLLLLASTRPGKNKGWWGENQISLSQLPQGASEALVRVALGSQDISEEALSYIISRTDGMPLYIEELVRMMRKDAFLVRQNGTYTLDKEKDLKNIPNTLQSLLSARLDSVPDAKEIAQVAATIGREFDLDLLVRAIGKPKEAIDPYLKSLIHANLVIEVENQNEQFKFRHALISDAAYSGMVESGRQKSHLQIAEALKVHFPERVENDPFGLARHLADGERKEEASKYGIKAVEQKVQRNSNQEGIQIGEAVTKWIGKIENEALAMQQEVDLNSRLLGITMMTAGAGDEDRFAMAQRSHSLLEQLRRKNIDHVERENWELKIKWALYSYYHDHSRQKEAREIGEEVLERARQLNDLQTEIATSAFLGQRYFFSGESARAEKLFLNVLEIFDPEVDRIISFQYGIDPFIFATCLLGLMRYFQGNYPLGLSLCQDGINYAEEGKNEHQIFFAYLFMGCYLALAGNRKLCRSYLDTYASKEIRSVGNAYIGALFRMVESWLEKDLEKGDKARQFFIKRGHEAALPFYELPLILLHLEKGNTKGALSILKESLQNQIEAKDLLFVSVFKGLLAIHNPENNGNDRDQEIREACHLAVDQGFRLFEFQIRQSHASDLRRKGHFDQFQKEFPDLSHAYQKLRLDKNAPLAKAFKRLKDYSV